MLASGEAAFACVCGKRGCFETHASAAGLVRHISPISPAYLPHISPISPPYLPYISPNQVRHWRAAGGDEGISLDDARSVVERMRGGDGTALSAWASYKADLATGLANLVTFYNPSLVVLGGGLAKTPELYDGLQAPT